MRVLYHRKVLEELVQLTQKDHARALQIVNLFEHYGLQLDSRYLKKLNKEIWELRTGRYRLLFGLKNKIGCITVLFYKKSQKTPKKELRLAVQRLSTYEE